MVKRRLCVTSQGCKKERSRQKIPEHAAEMRSRARIFWWKSSGKVEKIHPVLTQTRHGVGAGGGKGEGGEDGDNKSQVKENTARERTLTNHLFIHQSIACFTKTDTP